VIVELGFATRETVEQAVRAARSPGTTVARVLVEMNAISEKQLARATAERHGIDFIDLDGFPVEATAANLIAPQVAKRYRAVPVAHLGEGLLVAMADPADALGLDEIASMTERPVRPAVAARPELEALLHALPLDEGTLQDQPREELSALKRQLAGAEAKLRGERGAAGSATPEPPEVAELRARLAGAEVELEEARARLREAKEVSAELETLRAALAAAEAGLEARAREAGVPAADPRVRELELRLRRAHSEAEIRNGEVDVLRNQLTTAEAELVQLRAEISADGSERRAPDDARRALLALREESERELERWTMAEHDLLEALGEEKARRAELEQRLSEVESAAFVAERAHEELRLAHGQMREALRGLAEPVTED
jgi:hypothetical protein